MDRSENPAMQAENSNFHAEMLIKLLEELESLGLIKLGKRSENVDSQREATKFQLSRPTGSRSIGVVAR